MNNPKRFEYCNLCILNVQSYECFKKSFYEISFSEGNELSILEVESKKDNNLLLLNINMASGHGGASGRFEAIKEVAREYAFLFDLEKIHN